MTIFQLYMHGQIVITSYSIHYTKLYDGTDAVQATHPLRGQFEVLRQQLLFFLSRGQNADAQRLGQIEAIAGAGAVVAFEL